jgi:hypothetical protein
MKNNLNKEEQLLRSKLESVDFSYQESDWAEMDQMLGKKGFWSKFGSSLMIGLGLSVIISSAYLINRESDTDKPTSATTEKVESAPSTPAENIAQVENKKEMLVTKAGNEEPPKATQKNSQHPVTSEATSTTSLPVANAEDSEISNSESTYQQELKTNEVAASYQHGITEIKISGLLCEEAPLVVSAKTESRTTYQYLWKIDKVAQKDFSRQLSITGLASGEHQVEVQLIYEKEVVDVKTQNFYIEAKPKLDFSAEDLQNPYEDLSLKLKAQPSTLSNYRWELADLNETREGKELVVSFPKEGIYTVSLHSTSERGCKSSISKSLQVKEDFDPLAYDLMINGSNENDLFLPKAFTIRDDIFRMDIFNLSGEVIYTTHSIHEPWNGRVNNTGTVVNRGTYAWKVRIENKKGQVKEYFGKVKVFDFNR